MGTIVVSPGVPGVLIAARSVPLRGMDQHMSRGGVMLYHVWGYRASIEQRSGRVVEGFSQVAEEADMDGYRVTM
jgi:hypothetical protein